MAAPAVPNPSTYFIGGTWIDCRASVGFNSRSIDREQFSARIVPPHAPCINLK